MAIPLPSGIIPIRDLTTRERLYGDRVTSYRWEVLEHEDGTDHLIGYLDGVVTGSANLSWTLGSAVKGSGSLRVVDLAEPQEGHLAIQQLELEAHRLRPVRVIEGLPEEPLGVFLIDAAPEEWAGTGRTFTLDLLDRNTVLDQDKIAASFTVDTATPILAAVAAVIASAGEAITVDAEVADPLSSPMVWPVGTTKLQIVNDLLRALNYASLWVDGVGNYRTTPYVVPAKRPLTYELLNGVKRELIDGEESIYAPNWTRDRDMRVPNKVVCVQAATGDAEPRVGEWTNTNPDSPFSYARRGNRWIVHTVEGVETPEGDDAATDAFLEAKAQQILIAMSAVQALIKIRHLPVPSRVSDAFRFKHAPAGIDARHTATSIELEAWPTGLQATTLQEVIDL